MSHFTENYFNGIDSNIHNKKKNNKVWELELF